jgi:hypothetical protein
MYAMRRVMAVFGLLVVGMLWSSIAAATSGTCTVTGAAPHVRAGGPGNLDLPSVNLPPGGVPLAVEFDEATGAFSLSRDAWFAVFGPNGAQGPTGFGPNDFLIMAPGTVNGTIDAAGNITLPGFEFTFGTDFCPPPDNVYPITSNLDSGLQFVTIGPTPVELQGTALDFSTGGVTLFGGALLLTACGAPGGLVTGMSLTCTLNPIPDQSKLPPAPAVTKLGGLVKIGKPLPSTPPAKPDKGDILTLTGALSPGAAKLDATVAVFIEIADANATNLVVLEVPAGKLVQKGKTLQVTDTDGSAIMVLTGQKSSGAVSSATGGSIRFTQAKKKSLKLHARIQGLDLAGLKGSATATVALGPYALTHALTVKGTGNTRHLR